MTFGQRLRTIRNLHVLDSSDPEQIRTLEGVARSWRDFAFHRFASKSGTTTEPEAFFRYFYDRVQKTVGADSETGKQFVAITDPGTQLGKEAKDSGFRRIFENDPDDRRPVFGAYRTSAWCRRRFRRLRREDDSWIAGSAHSQANARTTKVEDAPRRSPSAQTIGALAEEPAAIS